jgi:hypothetical protein
MRKTALLLSTALVLVLTGCWRTGPSTGKEHGPNATHNTFSGLTAIDVYSSAALLPPGSTAAQRGSDLLRFEQSNGIAAYRADWKDPARLSSPPPGAKIVLRLELFDSIQVEAPFAGSQCNGPGDPGRIFYTNRSTPSSQFTSMRCTVTADERVLIDIGLRNKVPYDIVRCAFPDRKVGIITVALQPPPDGRPFARACSGVTTLID